MEGAYGGQACLLLVYDAHVTWSTARPSQLLQSACHKDRVGGRSLAPGSALFFREGMYLVTETTKPVGYDFETISTCHEGDGPAATTLGSMLIFFSTLIVSFLHSFDISQDPRRFFDQPIIGDFSRWTSQARRFAVGHSSQGLLSFSWAWWVSV